MSRDLDARLRAAGQAHLAAALARADGEAAVRLRAQVEALDLDLVALLVREHVLDPEEAAGFDDLEPAEVVLLPRGPEDAERDRRAAAAGEAHLRAGKVAVVLLAGGQGTRLGFDGPKGDFPVGPVTRRTLFDVHAAKVAAIRERYGCPLPYLVMTSPATDADTRRSFTRAGFYGLDPDSVRFFVQGTLPAVDRETGAILLDAPGSLALSPDGHGGLLPAMRREGILDALAEAGVETVLTFQVDNPLLHLADPVYVGHHVLAGAEMSSLVVRKVGPAEKMGVLARSGGRTLLVEYSDLPDDLAALRDADGELVHWAGSIAVHCIEVGFAERVTRDGAGLPFHRAIKRVPFVAEDGTRVEPAEPNAVKFEAFIFDALPMAERTMTLAGAREEQFSPIKNAEGDDSPATARRDLTRMYARWLEAAGVAVPRGADGEPLHPIEIDPRVAMGPGDLEGVGAELDLGGPVVIGPG